MLLIEISHIKQLIQSLSLKTFFQELMHYLREDFKHWKEFQKFPRHAVYFDQGVIELMPTCTRKLYSFKYVNGHPGNTKLNKPTIFACGLLAETDTGKPLLISEMTLLTALRTAATSALASSYLAKPKSKVLALIGCGAQSDFQILAHHTVFDLEEVRYYDLDPQAMERLARNLAGESFKLVPGTDPETMIQGADIIITATAARKKQKVLKQSWLEPGQHICGIGGDAPGKTELDPDILKHARIVVEYFPQTAVEGEIQNLGNRAKKHVYAELWEIISKKKKGRKDNKEITVYDSVGFAIEDYSSLRLVYDLAQRQQIGKHVEVIPEHLKDCKDLFSLIKNTPHPKTEVSFVGYASGIAANNPDCGLGPLYLRTHPSLFKDLSMPFRWKHIVQTAMDLPIATAVTQMNTELAQNVEQLIKNNQRFCVLAGDHSSAMGTWSGVAHAYRKFGDIGLIWIDAHMDSHTPETSETGNIHGMPVAHLLGHGIKSLKEILDAEPKLKPQNLCFIGIRSFESGEAAFLKKHGVKIFFMEEIHQKGMKAVLQEAIAHVSQHSCGFGISLDLDSIDPKDAPGVGCPEANGIAAADLLQAFEKAKVSHPFLGLEITEFNPIEDRNQTTAKLLVHVIETIYGKKSAFI